MVAVGTVLAWFVCWREVLVAFWDYVYTINQMGRGRPRKLATERRSGVVSFRLTDAEMAALRRRAGDERVSVWVRRVVRRAVRTGQFT